MIKLLAIGCFMLSYIFSYGQKQNIQERLGYPKDATLLIIHADDLGVSHSENMASLKALQTGCVNSASIMVPTPWFTEVADFAAQNPGFDLGLHLTITSEWKNYKWGPVSSHDKVPGLINGYGFFYGSVDSVSTYATASEVATEIHNQIQKAKHFGIEITHLDGHMGAVMSRYDFLQAYIQAGRDLQLPVLLNRAINFSDKNVYWDSLIQKNDVITDKVISASPEDFKTGMAAFYRNMFKTLEPGLNCLLIHLAYNNDEMQGITIDYPEWGAEWRQADFDFFTSDECKNLIAENNITLVTWRELRERIVRQNK